MKHGDTVNELTYLKDRSTFRQFDRDPLKNIPPYQRAPDFFPNNSSNPLQQSGSSRSVFEIKKMDRNVAM